MRISATGRDIPLQAWPQRGLTLVEMLVVLGMIAILGTVVTVPHLDLPRRRAEAAVARMELALAGLLRSSRAGERWRITWYPDRLQCQQSDMPTARVMPLPDEARILDMQADGNDWPAGKTLDLRGNFPPLLQLVIELGNHRRVLRSLPTGRVETVDMVDP